MSLTAPKSDSSERILAPEGQHVARAYVVAYIGKHKKEWQGKVSYKPQLYIAFELPEETHIWKEEKGAEPFTISNIFTFSMHENSGLRKFVQAWRGRDYKDQDEADAFDFTKMLGHTGLLTIQHKHVNGKTYANISSLVPLPKQLKCPDPVNTPVFYNLEEPDPSAFNRLPEWLKNKIMESKERQEPTKEDMKKLGVKDPDLDPEDEDDIPF